MFDCFTVLLLYCNIFLLLICLNFSSSFCFMIAISYVFLFKFKQAKTIFFKVSLSPVSASCKSFILKLKSSYKCQLQQEQFWWILNIGNRAFWETLPCHGNVWIILEVFRFYDVQFSSGPRHFKQRTHGLLFTSMKFD